MWGLNSMTLRSRPELRSRVTHLTDGATQAPLVSLFMMKFKDLLCSSLANGVDCGNIRHRRTELPSLGSPSTGQREPSVRNGLYDGIAHAGVTPEPLKTHTNVYSHLLTPKCPSNP